MTKALVESREQAIERLVEEAEAGRERVVAMRFDTSEMGGTWTEICAYGTAVRVRKLDNLESAVPSRRAGRPGAGRARCSRR